MEIEEHEPAQLVYITNLENGLQKNGTELNDEEGPDEKNPVASNNGETGSDAEHIEDFPKGKNKKNSKEHDYTKMDEGKEGKRANLLKSKTTRYHHDIPR